jgi:hypothetical protein
MKWLIDMRSKKFIKQEDWILAEEAILKEVDYWRRDFDGSSVGCDKMIEWIMDKHGFKINEGKDRKTLWKSTRKAGFLNEMNGKTFERCIFLEVDMLLILERVFQQLIKKFKPLDDLSMDSGVEVTEGELDRSEVAPDNMYGNPVGIVESTKVECPRVVDRSSTLWSGGESMWIKLKLEVIWLDEGVDVGLGSLDVQRVTMILRKWCDSIGTELTSRVESLFRHYKIRPLAEVGMNLEILRCGNFVQSAARSWTWRSRKEFVGKALRLFMKKERWKDKISSDVAKVWILDWGFWKVIIKIKVKKKWNIVFIAVMWKPNSKEVKEVIVGRPIGKILIQLKEEMNTPPSSSPDIKLSELGSPLGSPDIALSELRSKRGRTTLPNTPNLAVFIDELTEFPSLSDNTPSELVGPLGSSDEALSELRRIRGGMIEPNAPLLAGLGVELAAEVLSNGVTPHVDPKLVTEVPELDEILAVFHNFDTELDGIPARGA